jgi:hypothetical protein
MRAAVSGAIERINYFQVPGYSNPGDVPFSLAT